MEKQISIIIPTYNMEKYIGKCLDSLLIPEFDQVEVLVVNDGSKDRSSEIAHSYADRYPNSIRVIDKPNGNYGSCINAALPLATGRYVKILDADDTFDTAEFSRLVKLLPNVDDDVILTPFSIVGANDNVITNRGFANANVQLGKTYALDEYRGEFDNYRIQMHQILYNRGLFEKYEYIQSEGISYTDSEWASLPFISAKTYRCESTIVTKYLTGREGQTMSHEQTIKFFNNFITVLKSIVSKFSHISLGVNEYRFLLRQVIMIHEYVYFKALSIWSKNVAEQIREYDKWLKAKSQDIYNATGDLYWTEEVSFKVFEDIRKKGYPVGYKVPFLKRTELSLRVRLKSLFK